MTTAAAIGRDPRAWIFALALLTAGPIARAADEGWIGKRVVTKFGTVLRLNGRVVDDEELETAADGTQRAVFRIYRVEHAKGRWVWLKDERTGVSGWVTAEWVVPLDRAVDDLTAEIRAKPSDPWGYSRRSNIWRVRKEYDIAIADLNEAIRLAPDNACGWSARGNIWLEKKEYDRAIADYNQAIRLDPRYALPYACRGEVWFRRMEYDRAIADYSESIRLDPKSAYAHIGRGVARSGRGEHDRAIADFDEAIRLYPEYALAYKNRGHAWVALKEPGRAIVDYGEAIRLDPEDQAAYLGRGYAFSEKEEFDRAIAHYTEAIRLDPKDATAWIYRGYAWRAKKDHEKAVVDYTEAIRLAPKDQSPYFYRSVDQMILRRREAIEGFRAYLDLEEGRRDHSTYAAILGYLAARLIGDEAAAGAFLGPLAAKLDESIWPFPAVKFLRGGLDEAGLLALAVDDGKRTEARCFLGLDRLIKGRRDEALADFRWVRDHGTKSFVEYDIALAELDRLGEPARPKP